MEEQTKTNIPSEQEPAEKREKKRKFPLGGVIVLIIGVAMLLNNLGFEWSDNIWVPAIIIVIGLALLFKK